VVRKVGVDGVFEVVTKGRVTTNALTQVPKEIRHLVYSLVQFSFGISG
jgi:hypothetical protein